ncbi:MAG: hypothetical protein U1E28_22735 [Beijerinckiaceae bacterium]
MSLTTEQQSAVRLIARRSIELARNMHALSIREAAIRTAEATALARAQREHWPPVTLGQAHQFAREEVERLLDGDNA